MKKVLLTIIVAAGLYACGGGENKETAEAKPISNASTEETETKVVPAPVAKKDGKALIEGSNCRVCHKDDTKLIGPAYKEVANKYENNDENVKKLASRVMKGGQGVWGEIPMAAHPELSSEDAEAMVSYILSMNK
ncbi:MAG: cytochrome C [Chitinophagaceae bacterium]|nr:MAG: cytochrome C [Chitinophagaceae bacterium]